MKHRSSVENIRIIYREAPRPVVVPVVPVPPVIEEEPETGDVPAAAGETVGNYYY
jgi:hypothetical protein